MAVLNYLSDRIKAWPIGRFYQSPYLALGCSKRTMHVFETLFALLFHILAKANNNFRSR